MAIGIIAEYNPFHAGHAYQIAEIKKNLRRGNCSGNERKFHAKRLTDNP
ncbi:MAG: nucleotidyltransferase family protein [Selenomonadaceae bacterium]|nr:nucleotidyltransferase family protein [Selenomonadaceae bacterium]